MHGCVSDREICVAHQCYLRDQSSSQFQPIIMQNGAWIKRSEIKIGSQILCIVLLLIEKKIYYHKSCKTLSYQVVNILQPELW